ncbi:hypothetical protein CcaverHIS002_0407900 [Cutaneotrichosporon cavernicola]|uniref:Rrp15p-domain-containing protein n=1 Tax=Cutaneotrichosporon cavernicola TaxID=279322 RepID=A0AA48QW32_9TREE|nr:uncharacterized protein CcaverHIS019_0407880 [Cutaneotrichosporon cavernicola]BEI84186.1 hypothetical protein CcaverHIS002_0407900 [Cutaneotrichosporon cavernicola]BEI91968.1 hypothetical protein CcaverHIS019_0407880 [Cutaneotrichosporon cavernicola]BEI99739.1 hypothetical protein CcaverHIS631_0407820 [Cutaneotrichosporon cavernicola]BEJ07515.1 hypothetical protein CcaverHIS641_0407840 [Cutaneotrichosporon cavernicola]
MALKSILKNSEAGPSKPKAGAKASMRARVAKEDASSKPKSAPKPAKGKGVRVQEPEMPEDSDDNDFGDELDTDEEIERAQAPGEKKAPKKKRVTTASDFGAALTGLLTESARPKKRKGVEVEEVDDERKKKKTAAPILALSAKPLPPSVAEGRLERRAARALKAEREERLDRARIRNVLEGWVPAQGAAVGSQEFERGLRKTAQRGVIKLFNAILVASKNAEAQATTLAQKAGVKPEAAKNRKERDNILGRGAQETLTKEGFLDLVRRGGK